MSDTTDLGTLTANDLNELADALDRLAARLASAPSPLTGATSPESGLRGAADHDGPAPVGNESTFSSTASPLNDTTPTRDSESLAGAGRGRRMAPEAG